MNLGKEMVDEGRAKVVYVKAEDMKRMALASHWIQADIVGLSR
jgi:hypothetical protein